MATADRPELPVTLANLRVEAPPGIGVTTIGPVSPNVSRAMSDSIWKGTLT